MKSKDQTYRRERERRLLRRSIRFVRQMSRKYGRIDYRVLTFDELRRLGPDVLAIKVIDCPGSRWHGETFLCYA